LGGLWALEWAWHIIGRFVGVRVGVALCCTNLRCVRSSGICTVLWALEWAWQSTETFWALEWAWHAAETRNKITNKRPQTALTYINC